MFSNQCLSCVLRHFLPCFPIFSEGVPGGRALARTAFARPFVREEKSCPRSCPSSCAKFCPRYCPKLFSLFILLFFLFLTTTCPRARPPAVPDRKGMKRESQRRYNTKCSNTKEEKRNTRRTLEIINSSWTMALPNPGKDAPSASGLLSFRARQRSRCQLNRREVLSQILSQVLS